MKADYYDVIIIGSGFAGWLAAEAIRAEQPSASLAVVCSDDGTIYYKPMLSAALSQGHTTEQIIALSKNDFESKYELDCFNHTRVTQIDSVAKQIALNHPTSPTLQYGALILATGARPRPLDCPGSALAFQINHLQHYQSFVASLQTKQHITIIGSGLIGIEFAHNLHHAGYQVSLLSKTDAPLSGLFPAAMGVRLREHFESLGIAWHVMSQIDTISEHSASKPASQRKVTWLDQAHQPHEVICDHVLAAVGIASNFDLAMDAGIACDHGICTDPYGRTSAAHIYALGDCAQLDHLALKYIPPIRTAAKAIAQTIFGHPTPIEYPLMPIRVKTPSLPMSIVLPHYHESAVWRCFKQDQNGMVFVCHDPSGDVIGFALMGTYTQEQPAWLERTKAGRASWSSSVD